jgi:hypothetical protein
LFQRRVAGDSWPVYWETETFDTIKPGTFDLGNGTAAPFEATVPDIAQKATAFRRVAGGITCELDCNQIANQGHVAAGQTGDQLTIEELGVGAEITGSDPVVGPYLANSLVLPYVPGTSGQLIAKEPDATFWRADKGVYMPIKYLQPRHDYTAVAKKVATFDTTHLGQQVNGFLGIPLWTKSTADGTNPTLIPVRIGDGGSRHVSTAGLINAQTGVIIFEGIDKTANVMTKVKVIVQVDPSPTFDWGLWSGPQPPLDTKAMEGVIQVQRKLATAYPADYNDLSKIVDSIWRVVKPLANSIGLGGIAQTAEDIVGSVWQPISGIVNSLI